MDTQKKHAIGWIGCGRMGYAMAERLAKAGCNLAVWNRTRSKAEPLAAAGAKVVNSPAELAGCDIVFSIVAASDDFKDVTIGSKGLISGGKAPRIVVDCTSVSMDASAEVRQKLASMGSKFLACPVSGNAKVIKAGKLSAVASGPKDAFEEAGPYISLFAQGASATWERASWRASPRFATTSCWASCPRTWRRSSSWRKKPACRVMPSWPS